MRRRALTALISVASVVALYAFFSRPDVLPPPQDLIDTFIQLVAGRTVPIGDPRHVSPHLEALAMTHVTLQGSLLVSTLRVLIGLSLGVPVGVLVGLAMGWSRTIDDYVHPIYILFRSIPPLALISYAMLWLGHGEAHVLLPVVYATATTMVIPTYHGVRDAAAIYLMAARTLGARGALLFSQVVLPAAGPSLLAGLRTSLVIAWMTAVGAEMLMARRGIGVLLVGGGLWSSRFEVGVDPAVVMVGILGLAVTGYLTDAVIRLAARLTATAGWVVQ